MPAPRIEISLAKLIHNARTVRSLYASKRISVTAVTKGVCGSTKIAEALLKSGIRSIGDSRIANLRKMREIGLEAEFMLVRLPMVSEIESVIEFADISLNTEARVIRALSEEAVRRGRIHRVLLMVELEDRGNVRRAILALGRQDIEVSALRPREGASVLGASSDHLILDIGDLRLRVGDEVRFDIGYGALLRAMSSPFVEQVYLS